MIYDLRFKNNSTEPFHRTSYRIITNLLAICYLLFAVIACSDTEQTYTPKPKGFPRIDLPAASYRALPDAHPYQFEYSKYAIVQPDTFARAEPHWIFISYPQFGANIQLTYKDVKNNPKKLAGAIDDAYRLAAKHQFKASGISEATMNTKTGKKAILFELSGDVPSYFQFYSTDTTQHFLRGALYFNTAEKQDSLAPIIEYLKKDAMHLLNTLKWRK